MGRDADDARSGALAGVPVALPALTRALKLQAKAGKVGFDWNDPLAVLAKIREEADEIEAELAAGNRAAAGAEVGDLLFAVVNLARHLDADPEATLRATNREIRAPFRRDRTGARPTGQIAHRCRRWPRWTRSGTRRRPREDIARLDAGTVGVRSTLSSLSVLVLTSRRPQPIDPSDEHESLSSSPPRLWSCWPRRSPPSNGRRGQFGS